MAYFSFRAPDATEWVNSANIPQCHAFPSIPTQYYQVWTGMADLCV
jgi:hypothetical protein